MRQAKPTGIVYGGRINQTDLAIINAVREKFGLRSANEVMRMGLRALAREHGFDVSKLEAAANELEIA
jgi:hypothetical protein